MKSLKPYSIPFTGLKLGKHTFDFEVDDDFFNEFEYSLVKKGKLDCRVELEKQETMIILDFKIRGTVNLGCDRCLAEYPQQVQAEERAIAKFGEAEIGDDVDIITLSKNDHEINIAALIYEYINVAVPFVAVCGYEGKTEYCDTEMLDTLNKLAAGPEEQTNEDADPRWEALKKLNK